MPPTRVLHPLLTIYFCCQRHWPCHPPNVQVEIWMFDSGCAYRQPASATFDDKGLGHAGQKDSTPSTCCLHAWLTWLTAPSSGSR